ncbi:type I phosphomannose isomerase catalytic subunit [Spiroplasma endosymbiont of Amphibalanus improvisus]|uniref:type I phosphomannose isomerase catalytic subunit n=1 Tax=Spiroplasma endosymbiont of Amphibalanus improvisus TaxID=3066327 RepID=UPI00313B7873
MTYLEGGQSFKEFFEKNKSLFGNIEQFPLLTKIITANDNLSVQVHPDDNYAIKHHKMLGKPECWYIIDCPVNAKLIYGHYAKDAKELHDLVSDKKWDQLFQKIKIKKGDFINVPSGKIHAITKGVSVFELQRSSDITYRFYDYERKDKNGDLRELHIDHCLNVTTIPDNEFFIKNINDGELINNKYFTLHLITKNQTLKLDNEWAQLTIIEGSAVINDYQINKGDSIFIYNFDHKLNIQTNGKMLLSYKNV